MAYTATKKFAVITGASSGIGLELARQFAQNGFDLLICSNSDRIEDAAHMMEAEGAEVHTVRADLRTKEGNEKLHQAIRATGRKLDAIAINAGVGPGGAFTDTAWDEELEAIDLNVMGTTYLAKLVLKDMVAANHGRILFTGSVLSDSPAPYQAIYGATKAYILNLAESLREEISKTDVTITTLQPGATDTDFFRRNKLMDTRAAQMDKDDPADVAKDGFEALMAGKGHVVAHSVMSKVMGVAGKVLPKRLNAAAASVISRPGSGQH